MPTTSWLPTSCSPTKSRKEFIAYRQDHSCPLFQEISFIEILSTRGKYPVQKKEIMPGFGLTRGIDRVFASIVFQSNSIEEEGIDCVLPYKDEIDAIFNRGVQNKTVQNRHGTALVVDVCLLCPKSVPRNRQRKDDQMGWFDFQKTSLMPIYWIPCWSMLLC